MDISAMIVHALGHVATFVACRMPGTHEQQLVGLVIFLVGVIVVLGINPPMWGGVRAAAAIATRCAAALLLLYLWVVFFVTYGTREVVNTRFFLYLTTYVGELLAVSFTIGLMVEAGGQRLYGLF